MVYSANELLLWVTRENFAEGRLVAGCDFFLLPFASLNRKGVKNLSYLEEENAKMRLQKEK